MDSYQRKIIDTIFIAIVLAVGCVIGMIILGRLAATLSPPGVRRALVLDLGRATTNTEWSISFNASWDTPADALAGHGEWESVWIQANHERRATATLKFPVTAEALTAAIEKARREAAEPGESVEGAAADVPKSTRHADRETAALVELLLAVHANRTRLIPPGPLTALNCDSSAEYTFTRHESLDELGLPAATGIFPDARWQVGTGAIPDDRYYLCAAGRTLPLLAIVAFFVLSACFGGKLISRRFDRGAISQPAATAADTGRP